MPRVLYILSRISLGTKKTRCEIIIGTESKEAEKLFDISIHPEKEIVMILVEKALKNNILHALYKAVGLNTPGQGIAFSVPVEDVIGLTTKEEKKEDK